MTALPRALIGHTGFVGSNLLRGLPFDLTFNSSNIGDIRGRELDLVVCAGVSAVKWQANREPDEDWRRIQGLVSLLDTIRARTFVLISTVDVYGDPCDVFEDSPVSEEGLHPYGRHRLALERWVAQRFPRHSILRLPALFGTGLKKNAIYDLLHENMVDALNPASSFQWYPLRRLPGDLTRILEARLQLVNLACEPIRTSNIVAQFFSRSKVGKEVVPAPRYDMRTRHAAVLGGVGDYHLSASEVMAELETFLAEAR